MLHSLGMRGPTVAISSSSPISARSPLRKHAQAHRSISRLSGRLLLRIVSRCWLRLFSCAVRLHRQSSTAPLEHFPWPPAQTALSQHSTSATWLQPPDAKFKGDWRSLLTTERLSAIRRPDGSTCCSLFTNLLPQHHSLPSYRRSFRVSFAC